MPRTGCGKPTARMDLFPSSGRWLTGMDLSPVRFFDVFGQRGHPLSCAVSQTGPQLLSRILGLDDTQEEERHVEGSEKHDLCRHTYGHERA